MHHFGALANILILISTAIAVVMIFKTLRLSPVLGYLVSGAIIGDYGFEIITHEQVSFLAEFGVVFLLFAIGLELSFERLKLMRKYVFGLGSLQILITGSVIAGVIFLLTGKSNLAIIVGGGLALSSTAIVLQVLDENNENNTQVGRISLAILLQQDFAVVPLLVLVPILSHNDGGMSIAYEISISILKAVVSLLTIFICGRVFLRPVFRLISSDSEQTNNELFIALTLLICLTAAWTTEYLGLSLALGAFVSGILVAETEFGSDAEESIYPFKGLLLGLFFMSVGMKIDIFEVYKSLSTVMIMLFSLIAIKAIIITVLCLLFGFGKTTSLSTGILLSQGGEFAFILFDLAISNNLMDANSGRILLIVVTCSMAITPLLTLIADKLVDHFDSQNRKSGVDISVNTDDLVNHVIIAGFGNTGKTVSRVLEIENIHYVALDTHQELVDRESALGFPIFKGDVSQLSTLEALGIKRAVAIVLTVNNRVTIKKATKMIANHFPDVTIIARTHGLADAKILYEYGANIIIPEDYEAGLQLGATALKSVGVSEYEISRIKSQFRADNYVIIKEDEELAEKS